LRKVKCDGIPSAVTTSGYGRFRHSYNNCEGREFGKRNGNTNEQEAARWDEEQKLRQGQKILRIGRKMECLEKKERIRIAVRRQKLERI
jgi:hypothetical protein